MSTDITDPGTIFIAIFTAIVGAVIYLTLAKTQAFEDQKKKATLVFPSVEHPFFRIISPTLLSTHNGKDGSAIWVALYNDIYKVVTVYDVSSKSSFYGPGATYSCLAGKDASSNLAFMCLDEDSSSMNPLTSMSVENKKSLMDWCSRFDAQYPVIGHLHPHSTGLSLLYSGTHLSPDALDQLRQQELTQEAKSGLTFVDESQLRSRRERSIEGHKGHFLPGDTSGLRPRGQFDISPYSLSLKRAAFDHKRGSGDSFGKAPTMSADDDDDNHADVSHLQPPKKISHFMQSENDLPSIPGISLLTTTQSRS